MMTIDRRLLWTVVLAATQAAPAQDPPVPGRAVLRVEPGVSIDAVIDDLEAQLGGVTFAVEDDALAGRNLYLLSFEPAEPLAPVEMVLQQIEDDPDNDLAVWGEVLYEGHDPEGNTGSLWFFTASGVDFYPDQYAGTALGLPAAHPRSTGQGVVVAVVDSGLDTAHPLFGGLIAPGGYDFVADSAQITDPYGHGTFVAGLIHLVAPDAKLLPVAVLDEQGAGDGWIFAKGMFHAIDRGVEVINLSLGSTYNSEAIADALEEARSLGIVVVAAGGNQDAGEELEQFPAVRTHCFGVAAIDDQDVKADFSNYNRDFLISAPGNSVAAEGQPDGFDPDRTIYSSLPGNDYGIWEGTSMSTAFVSGAAALIRAQHPEWPAAESTHALIEDALASTAVDITAQNPGFEGLLGAGRLDAAAATLLAPPAPALGDIDNDGTVGIADFLIVLGSWGLVHSSADLDGDGSVGLGDFLIVLGNWS